MPGWVVLRCTHGGLHTVNCVHQFPARNDCLFLFTVISWALVECCFRRKWKQAKKLKDAKGPWSFCYLLYIYIIYLQGECSSWLRGILLGRDSLAHNSSFPPLFEAGNHVPWAEPHMHCLNVLYLLFNICYVFMIFCVFMTHLLTC